MLELLAKTRKLGAKPCNTLITHNPQLTAKNGELFEYPERYKRLVDKLNYFTVTHSDITYFVNVVSQFISSHTVIH